MGQSTKEEQKQKPHKVAKQGAASRLLG